MVMTYIHTHTKFQVNGQLVQQIEWKQADGQTDGRTGPIALPVPLTWLVMKKAHLSSQLHRIPLTACE